MSERCRHLAGRGPALPSCVERWMMGWTMALSLALVLTACGPGDVEAPVGDSPDAEDESGYVVYLEGATRDTLRGSAHFGVVVEQQTGRERFVIELAVEGVPTAGVYLSQGDTTRPEAGSYGLASPDNTGFTAEEFVLTYHYGLLRDLTSESGNLTLETVSDSLITGRFDARMVGEVVALERRAGELPVEGESVVQARGRFRAHRGGVGFVVDP